MYWPMSHLLTWRGQSLWPTLQPESWGKSRSFGFAVFVIFHLKIISIPKVQRGAWSVCSIAWLHCLFYVFIASRASEGKTVEVPYKGPVEETIRDVLGGVRSTCTYVGAGKLKELSRRTTFIRVTQQLNTVFGNDSWVSRSVLLQMEGSVRTTAFQTSRCCLCIDLV